MAENESLDVQKTRRWQSVWERIEIGASASDVADEFQSCLRKVFGRLFRLGFPLRAMLESFGDAPSLHEVVRECDGTRDYAQLLELAANQGGDPLSITEHWLDSVFHSLMDQFRLLAVPSAAYPTVGEFEAGRSKVRQALAPLFRDVGKQLLRDPDKTPAMRMQLRVVPLDPHQLLLPFPPDTYGPPVQQRPSARQASLLSMSLLGPQKSRSESRAQR
jgi:hypothetical protein